MKFKGSKKILSFLMSMVLIVSCFAVPIVAKADVPTVSGKSGIILGGYGGNDNVRHDGENYNIVNDGKGENTTAAFWSYSINSNIKNAATIVDLQPYSDIDDLSLELYYVNPSLVSDYVAEGGKHTLVDAIESTDADSRHQYFLDTFQCSDNLITTFDHKTRGQKALNLTTAVAKSLENGWSEVCVMAILSKNNNGSSSNVWSDYHVTMSALKNYTVDSVKGLLTDFENKFNSISASNVLTNVKPAYDAYVSLIKGYDAYYYGDNTSIALSSLAANLEIAMSNISTVKQNFDATAYFGSNVATGAYNNIVYAPAATDNNYGGNTTFHKPDAYAKYGITNNLVVVNDGNEAYVPIAMQMWGSSSFGAISWSSYVQSSQLALNNAGSASASLKQKWCYVKGANDTAWSDPSNSQTLPVDYSGSDYYQIDSKAMFYNRLYVSSSNKSTYYDKIQFSNLSLKAKGRYQYKKTAFSVYTYEKYEGTVSNPSGQVYVINYASVMNKVSDIVTKVAKLNVSDYKENGLASILSAYDTCTGANPNNFDYASNVESAVTSCGQAISDAIKATYTEPTTDSNYTKYDSLRNAIDSSREYVSTNYTADSLVAYGKAISAARNVFANDVATRGYDSPDVAQAKATALNDAKSALAGVDTDDAYTNFDAAVTVVNAMDTDAFIDSNTVANKVASAKAQVYTTLTDSADIEAYTLATGTAPTADLKNSTSVDTVTKDLLNFASNPDERLINHYTVSVGATVFNKGTETNLEAVDLGSKKYGEIVDINVNDLFSDVNNIADKTISWTVQYKNSNNETISNQKVRNDEPTISVKATANIVVTALVTDETKTEETTGYTVKFLDIYGKLADVAYTTDKPESGSFDMDSYTVGDKIYTPEIPFYTLKGFTVSSPDSNNVVTVRPTYTTEIRLGVTVYNGTAESSSLKSDSTVQKTKTVTVSTTVAHIGWAVVKDNKYQIVAYTDGDYQFVALGDDNSSLIYTPIIEQDGGYAVYNSDATTTALTASNVYQFENNSAVSKDKVSDDAYLNAKIAAKAPFTYVEEYTTLDVSDTTMYRYYVRITAGSDAQLIGFGVEADSKKYSLTSKNDLTGQYSASFRSAKSEFKAYVSYSFTYSYGGTDYNISTADYATL